MTIAFHGDADLKTALLDRLRCHADAGTLTFGATRWDGVSGTPMGVSARSEDAAEYAERFGYPLALAALLDTVTTCVAPDRALATALDWVACVEPGADLSGVAWQIADDLLVRLEADMLATSDYLILHDFHHLEMVGALIPRVHWAERRAKIEVAARAAEGARLAALEACLIACWSLRTSRSVLVELAYRWRQAAGGMPDPDFDEAARREAIAALEAIRHGTQEKRDAGHRVDIPALFRAGHPDLAARFEANLARNNARYDERGRDVVELVLTRLAAARPRTDRRTI